MQVNKVKKGNKVVFSAISIRAPDDGNTQYIIAECNEYRTFVGERSKVGLHSDPLNDCTVTCNESLCFKLPKIQSIQL